MFVYWNWQSSCTSGHCAETVTARTASTAPSKSLVTERILVNWLCLCRFVPYTSRAGGGIVRIPLLSNWFSIVRSFTIL